MFSNSVLISFIYRFLLCLKEWYAHSRTSVLLKAAGRKLSEVFGASGFLNFVRRDGWLVKVWENSWIYKLLEGLLNLPILLHRAYKKVEPAFSGSVLFRLVLACLDKLHIIVALFLCVSLIIPDARWYNVYSTLAAAGLFLLYAVRQIVNGEKFKGLKFFNLYFVLYAVCIVFSEVTSIFPQQSMRFLVFFLTCFMIMLMLAASVRTPQELVETVGVILLGLAACGAYGLLQSIRGVPVIASQVDLSINDNLPGRVFSTMGNANNFAQILCALLPFCLAMFLNSKHAISKLFFLALAFPPFISLLFTSSRSGWIGFAAGMFVFVFLINKKIIPVLVVAGLLCIPLMPDFVYRRLMTITNLSDSSIDYRFKIWRIAGQVLGDYWTTGVGLGTDAFVNVTRNYYLGDTNGLTPPHSHNLFLEMWIETGVLGFTAFLAFLLRLFKETYRNMTAAADKRLRNIAAAGFSAVMSICVIGLFEYVWYYPRVMLFFWVAVGITASALGLLHTDGKANRTGAERN